MSVDVKDPELRSELEDAEIGRTVADITEAEKFQFLQMIRTGLNPQEAANTLGYKGRPFRSLRSPSSPFYDEGFKVAFDEANGSIEHAEGRAERLAAEGFRRAMTDSDRLLEKYLMVYHPDFAVLREKNVNVSVNVLVQRYFQSLSADKIDQILGWLDEQEGDTIDAAEISELTRGDE